MPTKQPQRLHFRPLRHPSPLPEPTPSNPAINQTVSAYLCKYPLLASGGFQQVLLGVMAGLLGLIEYLVHFREPLMQPHD